MISQLYVVEETGVPGKCHRLIQSHWHLSQMPQLGSASRLAKNPRYSSKGILDVIAKLRTCVVS